MPKNKGKNAFFHFMLEWKKRAESNGRKFPNGLKDVQADPDCNEEWRNLTKQQKGPYEAMAKKDRIASQISPADKKTTFGESIKMLEKKEEEERQFLRNMNEYLEMTISRAVSHQVLPKLKFCFIHTNWFFKKIVNNSVEYFPAEYAIGVFSLEDGIEDVHHILVNSPIPLGYRREALETSQSTHKIPVENASGESDFAVMYKKLIDFLEPRKIVHKYPPLYTVKSHKSAVQSLLTRLCEAAGEDEEQFSIYEVESLFKHLANEAYKNRKDREIKYIPAYAEYAFNKLHKYIYKRGYECSFHKYVDGGSEYCSISVLHQWTWIICEEFCKSLGVDMKVGIHYPKNFEPDHSALGDLASAVNNMSLGNKVCYDKPECSTIVSMTGVSEQHRTKVSEMSPEDEERRRQESKPVTVVYSKLEDESNDKSVDKATENELKTKHMRNYLAEKQMRPPNTVSYAIATVADFDLQNDEKSFPPIGGRGVSCKSHKTETKKAPLGRGQGFA